MINEIYENKYASRKKYFSKVANLWPKLSTATINSPTKPKTPSLAMARRSLAMM